jgi:4-amino-4-deoxy-L-arabinose transferase-like glycosyltransferase
MIYEYIAAVNAYLALPFLAVLGVNVPALRALPIAQSMVAILFAYLFAREFLNRRVAALLALLLAVSPSFVFWSRQGTFVTSVTIPLSIAGVWSLWRWTQRDQPRYLYLGAFLFGLGTSAKLLFWWVIAGIVLAALVLNLDRIVNCLRQKSTSPLDLTLRWRHILIAGLLFAVGLLPLIIFNIQTGSTIHYIRDNIFSRSYYQVDNTKFAENLRERVKELGSVINGETFFYLAGRPYASWRYCSVFMYAVGILSFSVLLPHPGKEKGIVRAFPAWVTIALVVVTSYLVLRFGRLENAEQWYRLTPILAFPAATLTILLFARSGLRWRDWRTWLAYTLVGLVAALLLMVFVYLAWKLARWKAEQLFVYAVLALLLAPWLRAREEARRILFPLLVLAIALVGSSFTPTGLLFTHLAILVPWPILIVALTVDLIARRSGMDKIGLSRVPACSHREWAASINLGTLVALALVGMLVYDDIDVDTAYHKDLARIGGIGDHTSASYKLVDYLQDQGMTNVVAMDWGIQDVVQFLSEGQLNPPQLSSYEDPQAEDAAFVLRVREQLDIPETVYIFHAGPVFENRWETFQEIVSQEGRTVDEIKIIHDRATIPIFRLVRVPPHS